MAKKFKPKKKKRFMECDLCERFNLQFIINLKPDCFSKNGTVKERKAHRVCFKCGFYLFKERIYNFSREMRETYYEYLEKIPSKESKREMHKETYLVIHK